MDEAVGHRGVAAFAKWGAIAPRLMLGVAVACQLATVIITWPLWQVRGFPPNLSVCSLPQVPFAGLVVASLIVAVIWPRGGVPLHGLVLLLACLWDQLRIQPQFLFIWILMLGCVSVRGRWLARWLLASMWLWAGLHKVFSPEWFGPVAWTLVEKAGLTGNDFAMPLAVTVAVGETLLGLAAVFVPRYAALLCLPLHICILVFLSPWFSNYNPAVWPWNLATAIVATWLLGTGEHRFPNSLRQWSLVALILLAPAGYYVGWVEPHFANVLYSENMPKGWVTTPQGLKPIVGWGPLRVPFPDSPRLFVRYFAETGLPGEKLVVADPRHGVADGYFTMEADRRVVPIDRQDFLRGGTTPGGVAAVAGKEPDNRLARFHIMRLGARTQTDQSGLWKAVELAGPQVTDADLAWLSGLPSLRTLVLRNMEITKAGLRQLQKLSSIEKMVFRQTRLSAADLQALREALPRCKVEVVP